MAELKRALPLGVDAAIERVQDALSACGFLVLGRIDLHDVLSERLGVALRKYVVLAVQLAAGAGAVGPLRIAIVEQAEGTVVVASDPTRVADARLAPQAAAARLRLEALLAML